MTTCKHYHGIQNPCRAGIDFAQFRKEGSSVLNTFPCFGKSSEGFVCPSFELPSAEELEADEAKFHDMMANVLYIDNLVSSGVTSGSFICQCKDCVGTVTWRHPQNLALIASCDSCDWKAMS